MSAAYKLHIGDIYTCKVYIYKYIPWQYIHNIPYQHTFTQFPLSKSRGVPIAFFGGMVVWNLTPGARSVAYISKQELDPECMMATLFDALSENIMMNLPFLNWNCFKLHLMVSLYPARRVHTWQYRIRIFRSFGAAIWHMCSAQRWSHLPELAAGMHANAGKVDQGGTTVKPCGKFCIV